MEDVTLAFNTPLQWIQPNGWVRRWQLLAGDRVWAEMSFPSHWKNRIQVRSPLGTWTLDRTGFWKQRVTVQQEGHLGDAAGFTPNWTVSKGQVQLASGRTYEWKHLNFWATEFAFLDSAGMPLVTFRRGRDHGGFSDWFKLQARVEVNPIARRLPDLPLLVILGWYLMVLQSQDAAAAASA